MNTWQVSVSWLQDIRKEVVWKTWVDGQSSSPHGRRWALPKVRIQHHILPAGIWETWSLGVKGRSTTGSFMRRRKTRMLARVKVSFKL